MAGNSMLGGVFRLHSVLHWGLRPRIRTVLRGVLVHEMGGDVRDSRGRFMVSSKCIDEWFVIC